MPSSESSRDLLIFVTPMHSFPISRAVRAADETRRELEPLNEELAEQWGVRLETRTGINTGEVLVGAFGPGEGIAIGDAMNLGARLEQQARAHRRSDRKLVASSDLPVVTNGWPRRAAGQHSAHPRSRVPNVWPFLPGGGAIRIGPLAEGRGLQKSP